MFKFMGKNFTGAGTGACSCRVAVCSKEVSSVQCALCSVRPAKCEYLAVEIFFLCLMLMIIFVKIVGKNTRSTFECMVVLKSRGQGPKKTKNYGTNLSRIFNKNLELVSCIGESPYIQMMIWNFYLNLDIYDYVGKLQEQHFCVWLFSNP